MPILPSERGVSRGSEAPTQPPAEGKNPVRPYTFHGLDLASNGAGQAIGDCPFCSRESRFYASEADGRWDCKVCALTGNVYKFYSKLWELSKCLGPEALKLRTDRGLLDASSLEKWGLRYSITTKEWIVPSFNHEGKLNNLYRFFSPDGAGKKRLQCVGNHGLFGVQLFDPKKPDVYITEGLWKAVGWWEMLRRLKRDEDGGYSETGSESASLYSAANVLATPGANVWNEKWSELLGSKRVFLLYDSDHPDKQGRCSGFEGMKRVAGMLAHSGSPPDEVHYLNWGPKGYDPSFESAYDIKDSLLRAPTRTEGFRHVMNRVEPIPDDLIPGVKSGGKPGSVEIELLPCSTWSEVETAWRKALKWTPWHTRGLASMLAVATSTRISADNSQLWAIFVSPASTGKTTICHGLSVNKKYTKEVGDFTGLYSGFQTDGDASEDHSLISLLPDKTLVIPDMGPILVSARRDKILGDLRQAYDVTSSKVYGNKSKRSYNDRFTIIGCGTEALLELDAAELGARFLYIVLIDQISEEMESAINHKGSHRLIANRGIEANGTPSSREDPATTYARQLTGGYLSFLRENAADLMAALDTQSLIDAADKVDRMAQFVAMVRARPPKKQDEVQGTREMSARLNSQLFRLALCLPVVMNKKRVDDEVMGWVRQTALDTCRGKVLNLVKLLHRGSPAGTGASEVSSLVRLTGETEEKLSALLRFLFKIGVARFESVNNRTKWKLTERLKSLYEEVVGNA